MSDSVALTALLVSLVALITTIGQLLQQYLATADGYRRCKSSVMGLWAQRTRLRWRWAEFRFETVFVIPRITYGPLHGDAGRAAEIASGRCSLVETSESLAGSMTLGGWGTYTARRYYDSDELACWVALLAQLHKQGGEIVKNFPQSPDAYANDTTIPVVQFVTKSWDFMPTDIVRPMASTTVSDCAIMARRLGMVWKTFDPSTGSMRAEGNGHVITSTLARSLGTILQYAYTTRDFSRNCHYIPVKEADKLGFGLVEFDHRLFGPHMPSDLDVGSLIGISKTLRLIIISRHSRDNRDIVQTLNNFSTAMKAGKELIPGLNDLVPLCSAMLSVSKSSAASSPTRTGAWWSQIPAPNMYAKGLTSSEDGFRAFEQKLRLSRDSNLPIFSSQAAEILSMLANISFAPGDQHEDDWHIQSREMNMYESRAGDASKAATRNQVIGYHTQMTEYLQHSRVNYRDLVGQHIIIASRPIVQESATDIAATTLGSDILDKELLSGMYAYFDSLPELIQRVQDHHSLEPKLADTEISDAWLSMMFRAICWQMSHDMIDGVPPLPSEYWNSKMPVYIG